MDEGVEEEQQQQQQQQRPLVLIAEDNSVNQEVMKAMLNQLSVDCEIVSNGLEVLDGIQKRDYKLVLMDMNMPAMNGVEASLAIREIERQREILSGHHHHVPIVATTANVTEEDRAKCIQGGMDDFLSKPIRFVILQEILQRYGCIS
jgi:two-component system sensor histidine kinase/response regulator